MTHSVYIFRAIKWCLISIARWCLSRSRIPVYVGVDIKSPQSTTSNMSTQSNHSTISTDSTGYGWTLGFYMCNQFSVSSYTRFVLLMNVFVFVFRFLGFSQLTPLLLNHYYIYLPLIFGFAFCILYRIVFHKNSLLI